MQMQNKLFTTWSVKMERMKVLLSLSMQAKMKQKTLMRLGLGLGLFSLSAIALAEDPTTDPTTLGGMAGELVSQFKNIGQLMIGTAYIAGIGFGISAIFKFKQHKDNPTQVPVGTPFALLAISVLLVFLPSLYSPAGKSIFGGNLHGGGTKGEGLSAIPGSDTDPGKPAAG
jgi:intracellular multiplication protein IcmD